MLGNRSPSAPSPEPARSRSRSTSSAATPTCATASNASAHTKQAPPRSQRADRGGCGTRSAPANAVRPGRWPARGGCRKRTRRTSAARIASSSRTSTSHPGSTHPARLLELLATMPTAARPAGAARDTPPRGNAAGGQDRGRPGRVPLLRRDRGVGDRPAVQGRWPTSASWTGPGRRSRACGDCSPGSTRKSWTGSSGRGCSPAPPYWTGGG